MERMAQAETVFPPNIPPNGATAAGLPQEVISKIVRITDKGNDATVKRKKGGYKVYETKIVEK
jgi:hypothetical protein